MKAGPTISEVSFPTFNILIRGCIKVHKRKVETPEPRIRFYTTVLFRGHRRILSSAIFNPHCQSRREAISRTETHRFRSGLEKHTWFCKKEVDVCMFYLYLNQCPPSSPNQSQSYVVSLLQKKSELLLIHSDEDRFYISVIQRRGGVQSECATCVMVAWEQRGAS